MATTTRAVPPCLACGDTPGHAAGCTALNPEATFYLREPITGGHRDWTPAGIRYTGTTARREAVRVLLPAMRWSRMIGKPELPMSPGLLIHTREHHLARGRRHRDHMQRPRHAMDRRQGPDQRLAHLRAHLHHHLTHQPRR